MPTSFIIKDLRIFTGTSLIEDGYIHVSDNIIQSVGPSSQCPTNADDIIFKPGHTLLPGLIDAHIHADLGNPLSLIQGLRFGVTTMCDMHNEYGNIKNLRRLAGEVRDVADIKAAGLAATIKDGWPMAVVTALDKSPETMATVALWPNLNNSEDIDKYLDSQEEEKVDYIKLMHESGAGLAFPVKRATSELQVEVIKKARARGYKTVAHALAQDDAIDILKAGIDGTAHTIIDSAPRPELIEAYVRNNAWCNPTLAAIASLTKEGKEMQEKFAHDPRIAELIPKEGLEKLCMCMGLANADSKLEYALESVRQMKAAGIDIVCGSDSAGPALGTAFGLSLHHELQMLVNGAGFSPEEALKAATSVTARRFGFKDRGVLEQGRKADLLLVEGNPLMDIDATLNIRGVWRDGHLARRFTDK